MIKVTVGYLKFERVVVGAIVCELFSNLISVTQLLYIEKPD